MVTGGLSVFQNTPELDSFKKEWAMQVLFLRFAYKRLDKINIVGVAWLNLRNSLA
ncbi:MAG: hypothetical protein LBT95_08225 [Treponema sp.]|jgi:hypothetical protein|nr:hypothetical protein [Treponema sp.]